MPRVNFLSVLFFVVMSLVISNSEALNVKGKSQKAPAPSYLIHPVSMEWIRLSIPEKIMKGEEITPQDYYPILYWFNTRIEKKQQQGGPKTNISSLISHLYRLNANVCSLTGDVTRLTDEVKRNGINNVAIEKSEQILQLSSDIDKFKKDFPYNEIKLIFENIDKIAEIYEKGWKDYVEKMPESGRKDLMKTHKNNLPMHKNQLELKFKTFYKALEPFDTLVEKAKKKKTSWLPTLKKYKNLSLP